MSPLISVISHGARRVKIVSSCFILQFEKLLFYREIHLGQYATADFVMASDGHGGTLITDPPALIAQTQLTQRRNVSYWAAKSVMKPLHTPLPCHASDERRPRPETTGWQ